MLSVTVWRVKMLSSVMLSVVILSVVIQSVGISTAEIQVEGSLAEGEGLVWLASSIT